MFSTLPNTNFKFPAKFNLSSANAFNLDQSKNLSFGKELKFHHCSSANKCLLKVALFAAQLERYDKAIEIYEEVRKSLYYCFLVSHCE